MNIHIYYKVGQSFMRVILHIWDRNRLDITYTRKGLNQLDNEDGGNTGKGMGLPRHGKGTIHDRHRNPAGFQV